MLLKKAIEQFEIYMRNINRSEATIRIYLCRLKGLCRYVEGKRNGMMYIQDLALEDMEDFLYWMKQKGIHDVSRNKTCYMFKSFYNFCYKKKLVDRNIAEELEAVQFEMKERKYLNQEEMKELIEAIDNRLAQLVARTLGYTGLRINECLSLTLDDVDLENGSLLVRNTKGKKERRIPISKELLPYLVEYKNEWRNCGDSNRFFGCSRSGKLSIWAVNKVLHATTKRLRWSKKATCHSFRHGFATALCKKNVDLPTIQKLLGHANLSITGVYLHSCMDDMKEAVNAI